MKFFSNHLGAKFALLATIVSLVSLTLALSTSVAAREAYHAPDIVEVPYQESSTAWQEDKITLPAFPEQQDLIPLYISPTASAEAFIDGSSISLGQDKVVRYSLVIKTKGGAVNVSYEGLRCETRERRIYALGSNDKKWRPNISSLSSEWQPIELNAYFPVHLRLYKDYFCEIGNVLTPEKIMKKLRQPLTTY